MVLCNTRSNPSRRGRKHVSDRLTTMTSSQRLRRTMTRAAGLLFVWFVATEADLAALPVGIPLALAGAALSVILSPGTFSAIHLPGAMRFIRFFAVQSVLGGVDVALRALRPSMPLHPAIVRYPVRLGDTWPRVFFVNTISMLPGTLSSHFEGDAIEVHVLDCTRPVIADLAAVEERIADLFGTNLPPLEAGDVV